MECPVSLTFEPNGHTERVQKGPPYLPSMRRRCDMKRILFGGILTAFLILWQPGSARLTQEKGPIAWQTVADFKVLKLWEDPSLGPKELQSDPLAFYKKYEIFKPSYSDFSKGQFVLQLSDPKAGSYDPYLVVVV